MIKLEPIDDGDLLLYEQMFCDPEYMAELGGIQPIEKVSGILSRQVNCMRSGAGWVFKIVVVSGESHEAVGTVCVWSGWYKDAPAVEMGWGVVRKHQGRGYGKQGVLKMAKEQKKWGVIHAFTTTTNASSNSLCRRVGFVWEEECDIDYDGRSLHCNHYSMDTGLQQDSSGHSTLIIE